MTPARCKPEEHRKVWKAEQWICDICGICGCEPVEKKRGQSDAKRYELLIGQKIQRDQKVTIALS